MKPLTLALALTLVAASLSAQEARPPAMPFKDGGTATLLSLFLAGGGQIYSGESGRGIAMLFATAAPLAVGIAATECHSTAYDAWCDMTPMQLGLLASLAVWGYSIWDAPRAAERANERNGYAPRASVRPTVGVGRAGEVRLGLAVRR